MSTYVNPVLASLSLSTTEGESLTLKSSMFGFTNRSAESIDSRSTFAVTKTTAGSFYVGNLLVKSFTYADVLNGTVQFRHDGSNLAPAAQVTFAGIDGHTQNLPINANVSFNPVNDAPIITAKALTLKYAAGLNGAGAPVALGSSLKISDLDSLANGIKISFQAVNCSLFKKSLISGSLLPLASDASLFVTELASVFIQGTSPSLAPTLKVIATDADGAASSLYLPLRYSTKDAALNNAPSIVKVEFNLSAGQKLTLSPDFFTVTDELPETLLYTATAKGGKFLLNGVSTTTFTHAEVAAGAVAFTHDGLITPSFKITAKDILGRSSTSINDTIHFNDVPNLSTPTPLKLAEGGDILLKSTVLKIVASNPLTPFLITVVQNDYVSVLVDGFSRSSFSSAELAAGKVKIRHDGSENHPKLVLKATGNGLTGDDFIVPFTFTEVNDAATFAPNFHLSAPGESRVLSLDNLRLEDEESADYLSYLFRIIKISNAVIKLSGTVVKAFTLGDVEKGLVSITHDGSALLHQIDLALNDGKVSSGTKKALTSLEGLNTHTPVLINPGFPIAEGGTILITTAHINATDVDAVTTDASLLFSVVNVAHGTFKLGTVNTNSFTLADIKAKKVSFVHNGDEVRATYEIAVSDGSNSSGFSTGNLAFSYSNDSLPTLDQHQFNLSSPGQTLALTAANFAATDADLGPLSELVFTVANVTHGSFRVFGTTSTRFTAQNIADNAVTFVHDGSAIKPTATVTIGDGIASHTSSPVEITISLAGTNLNTPVITAKSLSIAEGATVTLNINNFNVTDADPGNTDSSLSFTVSPGISSPLSFKLNGSPTLTFSLADIKASRVTVTHNGNEVAANNFSVTASDGERVSNSNDVAVTYTPVNDQTPVITAAQVALANGQTVTLNAANFAATDADTNGFTANTLATQITFSVASLAHGTFKKNGVTTLSFTADDINNGRITFSHDGSASPSSATLTVTDDLSSHRSPAQAINFNISGFNSNPPILTLGNFAILEGATLNLSTSHINASDADAETSDADLTFTVQNVVHGQFRLSSLPTTSFTLADVKVGRVSFTHDGAEIDATPNFQIRVDDMGSDGGKRTEFTAANSKIIYTATNDQNPTWVPGAPIAVGFPGTIVRITTSIFNITDGDVASISNGEASSYVFNPLSVNRGSFVKLTGGTAEAPVYTTISSFTLADIRAEPSLIYFRHDGSAVAPTGRIYVADGANNNSAQIDVSFSAFDVNPSTPILLAPGRNNGVNGPDVVQKAITIAEDGTVVLTSALLNATDADAVTTDSSLVFSVSEVANAEFRKNGSRAEALDATTFDPNDYAFTLADVKAGRISLAHTNGSELAPSFVVKVSDGKNVSAKVSVNTADTVRELSISPSSSKTFTPADFGYAGTLSSALIQVKILELPSSGTLKIGTSLAAVGNVITAANISSLQFFPFSFTYIAKAGDISLLGTSYLPADINNAANTSDKSFTALDFGFNTANQNLFTQVTFTSLPTQGVIKYNGVPVTVNQVVLAANVGQLQYFAAENSSTAIKFEVTDVGSLVFSTINDQNPILGDLPVDLNSPTLDALKTWGETRVDKATDRALIYTLSSGSVSKNGSAGVTSFSQDDLDQNLISNPLGTLVVTAKLTPNFEIAPGVLKQITTKNLAATDADFGTTDADLKFYVVSVSTGSFKKSSGGDTPTYSTVSNFTLAEVKAGLVFFQHNSGTAVKPAASVYVTDPDAGHRSETTPFIIEMIDLNIHKPVFTTFNLPITEGGIRNLSTTYLNATDADPLTTDSTLVFTVSTPNVNDLNGSFQKLTNSTWSDTSSFTLADVKGSKIRFVHNDSEFAPAFSLTLSDGDPTHDQIISSGSPKIAKNLSFADNIAKTFTLADFGLPGSVTSNQSVTLKILPNNTDGTILLNGSAITANTLISAVDIAANKLTYLPNSSDISRNNATLSSETTNSAFTNVFTNVNDHEPAILKLELTLARNQSKQIAVTDFNVSDADLNTPDSSLRFIVQDTGHGVFQKKSPATGTLDVLIFTLADVKAGLIYFTHDGSAEVPTATLTAADDLNSHMTAMRDVTFTYTYSSITANAFFIIEGTQVLVTDAMINGQTNKANVGNNQLIFTPDSEHYSFHKLTAPNTYSSALSSFSKKDITDGIIYVKHNGINSAGSLRLTLSDGTSYSTPPSLTTITFSAVNDAPSLDTNQLFLSKNTLDSLISPVMLKATDEEGDAVSFTLISVTGGSIQVNGASSGESWNTIALNGTFSMNAVTAGRVRFRPDADANTNPSLSFKVTDPSHPDHDVSTQTVTANVTALDASYALLTANSFSIAEGATVTLSDAMLNATGNKAGLTDAQLIFSATTSAEFSFLKDGVNLANLATPGINDYTFNLADVKAGLIKLRHDDSEAAGSIAITVTDSTYTSTPANSSLNFSLLNDNAPVITQKSIAISNNQLKTLALTDLNASDLDTNDPLKFTVSNVTHGEFRKTILDTTMPVTSFYLSEVAAGTVFFQHDNSHLAPSAFVTVADNGETHATTPVAITFNFSDIP